jgi:hypothetical protein
VLTVISDRKIPHYDGTENIDYYTADIISSTDYYPFGMPMPERNYTGGENYRFGFNGQEKIPELDPAHTTAEFWEYDGRTGRRWNLDPKPTEGVSEYSCFGDNPILYNDINGDIMFFASKLSKQRRIQIQNWISILFKESAIFKYIIRKAIKNDDIYTIGEQTENTDPTHGGYFDGGGIKINWSSNIGKIKYGFKTMLSEEFIHLGQNVFSMENSQKKLYEDKVPMTGKPGYVSVDEKYSWDEENKPPSLSLEVEARVIQAYVGIFNEKEKYVKDFSQKKEVKAYFDALRSGDSKAIAKTEKGFREQVKTLAEDTVANGYGSTFDQLSYYKEMNCPTPFFDNLTKEKKMKK